MLSMAEQTRSRMVPLGSDVSREGRSGNHSYMNCKDGQGRGEEPPPHEPVGREPDRFALGGRGAAFREWGDHMTCMQCNDIT